MLPPVCIEFIHGLCLKAFGECMFTPHKGSICTKKVNRLHKIIKLFLLASGIDNLLS